MDTYWLHDTEFNFHVAHCVLYLEPGLTASLLSQLIVERILDKTNDEGKRIFRRPCTAVSESPGAEVGAKCPLTLFPVVAPAPGFEPRLWVQAHSLFSGLHSYTTPVWLPPFIP
ncbi:hypothetical protein MTO96_037828 [Rhipicephalus appendiculatus]